MSGLQNFLAPFSHLLFANRNLDIVVLCFVLFGVAIYALTNRWRADRLERELADSRSNATTHPGGRRYAATASAQEPISEPGGLPPIKGGRSYARNLGSALQKAGVSGPQIYSPPTPPGFAPNSTPMPGAAQPGMGQPGIGQPYAPPSGPWSAPAPAPSPWAFPAGTGRNAPAPSPGPSPFYGAPPAGAPTPTNPFAPTPSSVPGGPGHFAPPPPPSLGQPAQPSGPFAPPFGAPASGPVPTPPAFAPPGAGPMTPPAAPAGPGGPAYPMPPMNQPPMMQPPMEPEPADASRRGKPKRRRFNFNVLENLEKMVQAKQAEPAPQTGWTPPPAPIPPAAQTPPVSPVTASAPTAPAPIPALTPSPETATVAPKPAETAPMLPFLFGGPKPTESAKDASAPAAELKAPEESAENETVAEESTAPEAETTASNDVSEPVEVASEPVAEETSDTGQSSRRSMRSMMFGEEITDAGDKPAVEPEPASIDESDGSSSESATAPVLETEAPSSAESESSWPSYPWERRQDAGATSETEEPTADAVHETTGEEETPAEPEAWKSSEELATASTSESDWSASNESAPDAVPAEPAVAEVTETTSASDSSSATSDTPERGKPSAGTLVIIEDDQTTASYYSTLFRGNGYEVEVASDGVSGVDLCARVQPQVILLDVMMPRQNGILVLQTLRASDETKNTPVVVMSNFSEPTLIKRALQLGALEYVIKTQVEGPALLNALPRWMNREKAFAAA